MSLLYDGAKDPALARNATQKKIAATPTTRARAVESAPRSSSGATTGAK